jgi:hypothetical protein
LREGRPLDYWGFRLGRLGWADSPCKMTTRINVLAELLFRLVNTLAHSS